jgi:hypothetical protein
MRAAGSADGYVVCATSSRNELLVSIAGAAE